MTNKLDRLQLITTFLAVAEVRSLSAAARTLGTSQPTVSRRLRDLEGRVERAEKAAEEAAELNGPIVAHSPTGDAAQDLQAAMRLAGEDAARGGRALETVIVTWPNTPQAREANSRLGDLHVAARDNASAVQAYAAALNGWPRTPWAYSESSPCSLSRLKSTDRAWCSRLWPAGVGLAPLAWR